MDTAQRRLRDQIDDATQRLLGTARVIAEPDLRAPSMLPGWTRAYVLAHLARGADAMRSLMIGARDGPDRPAYVSAQARAADIEQAAGQKPAELVADVASAAMAWRTMAGQLSDQAWRYPVRCPAWSRSRPGSCWSGGWSRSSCTTATWAWVTARPTGPPRSPAWSWPSRCAPSARTA